MEYLILVGGILSLPLIHYSTQPVVLQEKTPEKDREEAKKNPEIQQVPMKSEKEIKDSKDRAKARQDRVLSALNPNEQVLFKEYVNEIMNPTGKKSIEKCVTLTLMLIFCIAVLGSVVYLFTLRQGVSQFNFDL